MVFHINDNAIYDIFMIDPNRFNGIRYNEESFERDKLKYKFYNDNTFYIEIISETFMDCIDRAARNDLTFLGCNVPWFTDDEETICRSDTPDINKIIQRNFGPIWNIFTFCYVQDILQIIDNKGQEKWFD